MVYFPNQQLEIYEYNETSDELTPYKEPKAKYTYSKTIPVDFQTINDTDMNSETGEILTDTYKAYVSENTIIKPGTKFKLQGKPDTYALIGHETLNNHFTPTQHVKLILQMERQPSKLIKPEISDKNDN
jgi:hypothetical protein